jgi:hypothetical protein
LVVVISIKIRNSLTRKTRKNSFDRLLEVTGNPVFYLFRKKTTIVAAAFLLQMASVRAVILFSTSDPDANTSAPTGILEGSGWQFEGSFGPFLGTPIAPQFFLTAKHIGTAGSAFSFQGQNYTIVNHFFDPASDLAIWQVAESFPYFAPLYTQSDELGQHFVAIGRGTERGSAITNGTLRGWNWGSSDGVQRWGENVVSGIKVLSPQNEVLYATFDQDGLPNECHLSVGDSAGSIFLNDGRVWRLAAIHYAVDGYYYTDSNGGGRFDAALFDARDYYVSNGGNPPIFTKITGPNPVPSGFYSTRVSSRLGWIYSVLDPGGDIDGDGIPNIFEYAFFLNPVRANTGGTPRATRVGIDIALIYTKVLSATDLVYRVEKSTDLVSWAVTQTTDQVLDQKDGIQTIQSIVKIGTYNRFFLRLKVTRS